LHRCLFLLRRRLGIRRPLPLFLDTDDAQTNTGPTWAREMAQETTYGRGHPDAPSVRMEMHVNH
jgi:hypothetical protein